MYLIEIYISFSTSTIGVITLSEKFIVILSIEIWRIFKFYWDLNIDILYTLGKLNTFVLI